MCSFEYFQGGSEGYEGLGSFPRWCGLDASVWLVFELCLAYWMGPLGVIPLFAWFVLGFVCFGAILLFGPLKSVEFIVCLRWFMRVVLVMVLFIFFLIALLRLVFDGTLMPWHDLGLGYLCLVIWLALFSISGLLFLMLGGTGLLLIFVAEKGFRSGPLLDIHGSLQLLNSPHVRERDKALLRDVMVGGVWNGMLLGRVRCQPVPCRFCGAPDHGPTHLLSAGAPEIGFRWDPLVLACSRPGLPLLSNLAGPIQHFRAAIFDAWQNKAAADLCGRKGFRGGPLLDIRGSLQLLNSSHVRDRDKGLLRCILVGGAWNVFLLSKVRGQPVPCRFCGAPDNDGHLFGDCPFPLLVEIRDDPEFHDLTGLDEGHWPRCLLWHGWLPMLSGVNGALPWAVNASESAAYLVGVALGRYSSGLIAEWTPSGDFDHDSAASSLPDHPTVWTDGSLVLDPVTGVSSSSSGFFAHQSENCWSGRRWGHVDGFRVDHDVVSCRGFCSVPGPLQSVQKTEMWGVILTLQSSSAVHHGVDNLGVVRHVGRLLDGCHGSDPFELVNDGDLLLLIERMFHLRELDTVRISKVKGHADEGMVLDGRVPEVDRLGHGAADEAADFGRRRVSPAVIDARRNLSGVCGRWYPVVLVLHRFFIAISRAVVNHDGRGGTAPGPLVWSAGALPKRRRLVHAVRDRAFLPGPPGIWHSEWFQVPAAAICAEDIALWPYTPGLLVKWVSFLGSLHWPAGGLNLGVGGISFVELLIFHELWAGERLSLEKAHPRYLRPGRPISVSAVPFGPGIDLWRPVVFRCFNEVSLFTPWWASAVCPLLYRC